MNQTIAETLVVLRKNNHISQEKLAEDINSTLPNSYKILFS